MITHGGRLPAETSRFFGRSHEAAAIREALSGSRLVTLAGPGGVGKTRLALRAAEQLTATFSDGVHLVPLSAARGADGLMRAVTAALGPPLEPGLEPGPLPGRGLGPGPTAAPGAAAFRAWADRTATGLGGRRMLLILDTCEHLVDVCAAFAHAVLSGAEGPVILVTSRQPLELPGEAVVRIPPLGLTGDGSDAVALFADRAGAALPGFALTEESRPKVAWLCRALDGIPLEIELAALRLRAVGLDDLLARLPGRLRLLVGGRRTDDRQQTAQTAQTVQASIGWSYDLCGPAERLLWNRLSVFRGGFGLAAAETVCGYGELTPGVVLETLIGLVDKSVILRDDDDATAGGGRGTSGRGTSGRGTSGSGEARYRLLEIVREQGAARADGADAAECAARHRDYYRAVARNFATAFVGPDQVRLVSALGRDTANLRLAYGWPGDAELADQSLPWWAWGTEGLGGEAGDAEAALFTDLMAALADAFESLTLGDPHECAARCAALLAALPEGERWVRGWAEWVLGLACWRAGAVGPAGRWLRHGLGRLAPFGDDRAAAAYLEAFAWLAAAAGEHRRTARLQGAADRRWRRLTEPGSGCAPRFGVPLLRAERGRAEGAARDALGTDGYTAEHGAGATLTGEDALRYALGQLSAPFAPRQPGHPDQEHEHDRARSASSRPGNYPGRWQRLTSREREVALLVAQGLTNKDIAASLFVSKRTVDAHVEHILAKLTYTSRVQVAALVAADRGSALAPRQA